MADSYGTSRACSTAHKRSHRRARVWSVRSHRRLLVPHSTAPKRPLTHKHKHTLVRPINVYVSQRVVTTSDKTRASASDSGGKNHVVRHAFGQPARPRARVDPSPLANITGIAFQLARAVSGRHAFGRLVRSAVRFGPCRHLANFAGVVVALQALHDCKYIYGSSVRKEKMSRRQEELPRPSPPPHRQSMMVIGSPAHAMLAMPSPSKTRGPS